MSYRPAQRRYRQLVFGSQVTMQPIHVFGTQRLVTMSMAQSHDTGLLGCRYELCATIMIGLDAQEEVTLVREDWRFGQRRSARYGGIPTFVSRHRSSKLYPSLRDGDLPSMIHYTFLTPGHGVTLFSRAPWLVVIPPLVKYAAELCRFAFIVRL